VRSAVVSRLTAGELATHYGRRDVTVIPDAVALARVNLPERLRRWEASRSAGRLAENEFVLLLVSNDWEKRLRPPLKSVAANRDLPLNLLVVGRDAQAPFLAQIRQLELGDRVLFPEPSADIMQKLVL